MRRFTVYFVAMMSHSRICIVVGFSEWQEKYGMQEKKIAFFRLWELEPLAIPASSPKGVADPAPN